MTATEIQRRVDAWLAARNVWASETKRRRFLVGQWRHVCHLFGADSDAALGVLRGIVREALGDQGLTTSRMCRGAGTHESPRFPDGAERTASGGWRLMRWGVTSGGVGKCRWCDGEFESLIATLEAAP